MTVQQLEQSLLQLPTFQRLRIARALLDSVLTAESESAVAKSENPLIDIAGVFSGGDGNSADRIDELITEEVIRKHRLS